GLVAGVAIPDQTSQPVRARLVAPINPGTRAGLTRQGMTGGLSKPVVHLELHSGDLPGARAFYAELCGWRQARIDARCGSYLALELGRGLGGGMVECDTERPLWL